MELFEMIRERGPAEGGGGEMRERERGARQRAEAADFGAGFDQLEEEPCGGQAAMIAHDALPQNGEAAGGRSAARTHSVSFSIW